MENAEPKKTRRSKKTNDNDYVHESKSHNVGVKKTTLMKLAESYGDTGLFNPRSIDPIVFMLGEMAEAVWGRSVIDNCRDAIALSNADFPKKKALGFLTDQICRVYLPRLLAEKPDSAVKFKSLPVLNDASYVEYFMAISLIEKEAFRTSAHKVAGSLIHMVTGYETEQPFPVCSAAVGFFRETKDQKGFEKLFSELCQLVKSGR